jgi:hypothetical protein
MSKKARKNRKPTKVRGRKQDSMNDTVQVVKPVRVSISSLVRLLVVANPQATSQDVANSLVTEGWNQDEVKRRMSTIATIRADVLATLSAARAKGWTAPTQ